MRRALKVFLLFVATIVLAVDVVVICSPYHRHDGYDGLLIEHHVEIDAPVDPVFAYLGNSDNARHWSVFVDHITALNPDSVRDGAPGSRRRCFTRADETGARWDETITVVEPGYRRQLICYDLKDFPMSADGLMTEQRYVPLGPDRCRLSFLVFLDEEKAGLWDEFKTMLGAWRVKSIFAENMANIKRLAEERYGRPIRPSS